MPTLLQINVGANWGSTGKIAEQIGQLAMDNGWISYIAYARNHNSSTSNLIKIGNSFDIYEHYAENLLFDNEGLASRKATQKLVRDISKIKPDIIHLHNIHDHYLNYPILFKHFSTLTIPIIWTQHDCWAFTGGCAYYSLAGCEKWKIGCGECPIRRSPCADNSRKQFNLRKQVFTSVNHLILVPVSNWMANEVKRSFLGKVQSITIFNGVDINTFTPLKTKSVIREKYGIGDSIFYLAVAYIWSDRKALPDYIRLAALLRSNEKIVLVGLSKEQRKNLPPNIIPIPRTQDVKELVALYNEASIVLNLSYEETFGLTTVEGLACGTPGIIYNCTASPELITSGTGKVVEPGDISGVYNAIQDLLLIGKDSMSKACRDRAVNNYDKDKCFEAYVRLYEEVIKQ